MAPTSRPDSFELADYLGVLRRRWWIILLAVVVGAGVGAAYTEVSPKTYTAGVLVQVNPLPNNANAVAGRTGGKVDMDNEAQIVQSVTVAALAARQFHTALSLAALAKKISVSVPANTTFLEVKCGQSGPAAAAECANAFGRAYLDNRRATAVNSIASEIASQNKRITALATRIAGLKAQLNRLPAASAGHVKAQLSLTADQNLLTGLTSSTDKLVPFLGNLNQPNDAAVGQIATPATAPTSASSPRALLLLPSGALAGLLVGLLVAFLIDFRDRRIHSVRDVERFLDLPVLVNLSSGKSRMAPALAAPRSRAGQAFTELGQYIAASLGDGSHVVFVAGTSVGPGCSVVAANLAATLARTRSEVVLVCADPHGTVTPQLLGISDSRGLAEVLSGSATASEVGRSPSDEPRLQVITPGIDTSNVLVHLQYEASRRLLGELRRNARYVIVEVQSVGEDADAFALAEFADAAVMAIETSLTTRSGAADCLHRLDRLRTSVLGTVVLPPPSSRMPSTRPAASPRTATADSPRTTDDPRVTDGPRMADGPRITDSPRVTDGPRVTDSPRMADGPRSTDGPRVTDSPRITDSPRMADGPRSTDSLRTADSFRMTDSPRSAGSRSASAPASAPLAGRTPAQPPRSGGERRRAASSSGSRPDGDGNGRVSSRPDRPDPLSSPLSTSSGRPSSRSERPSSRPDPLSAPADRPSSRSARPSPRPERPNPLSDPLSAPADRTPSLPAERPPSLPADRPPSLPADRTPSLPADRPPSLPAERPSSAPVAKPARVLNETRPLPRVSAAGPAEDLDDPVDIPSPADKIAGS